MGLFKKPKEKEKAEKVVMASAPEEPETKAEIEHIEKLSEDKPTAPVTPVLPEKSMEYRELPVCMSQSQINNLVIENNIMLKQILSDM